MRIEGSVVVVTGGASGIGAALARRLAAERAAAVVVVDLDAARVADAVAALGPDTPPGTQVSGLECDVSERDAVESMLAEVEQRHGPVDLYCSNAGIGSAEGVSAADEVWGRVWDVNLMAHVHAARVLVPQWIERGGGHLLVTASAAGLLTNLGDAPYSVTKHAAVALAEWISVTHGDSAVGVSCLCPQGVRTPLLFGADSDGALATEVVKSQRILEPDEVAEVTIQALSEDRFLVLPHPEVADYERARAGDRERWLAAMRRLQARIDGLGGAAGDGGDGRGSGSG